MRCTLSMIVSDITQSTRAVMSLRIFKSTVSERGMHLGLVHLVYNTTKYRVTEHKIPWIVLVHMSCQGMVSGSDYNWEWGAGVQHCMKEQGR